MNPTVLLYFILGAFAGILAGMFGIGGGVIIVPALIFIGGFTIASASGTSLAALLLPVAILAVLYYYRKGYLDVKTASLMAFGLFAGSYFGAKAALMLPGPLLKQFYGIFLLYPAYRFIEPVELWKQYRAKKIGEKYEKPDRGNDDIKRIHFLPTIGLALFAGVLSGMFGIGGGLVLVPMMVSIMKFPTKTAIGTSLAALMLPVGLPGVIVYHNAGMLDLPAASLIAAGIVAGSAFGSKITLSMSGALVKRVYGFFLLVMSLDLIFLTFV